MRGCSCKTQIFLYLGLLTGDNGYRAIKGLALTLDIMEIKGAGQLAEQFEQEEETAKKEHERH
jgi:hypothetical protein